MRNTQEENKHLSKTSRKKHIRVTICLSILFVFIFIILTARLYYFLHPAKDSAVPQTAPDATTTQSRVWQILLNYNTQTQKLALTSIAIKKGTAAASSAHTSQYQLLVLNKTKQVLFRTDIHIAEQILYDVYYPLGSTRSGELFKQPLELTTLITIPYLSDADTVVIQKDGTSIVEFTPPKELSFNFIQQSYAATCNMLHIVFISDGYTDMTKFHADVAKVQSTFLSKEPFASNSNIFDFQTVDNPSTNNLGCLVTGSLNINCLNMGPSLQKISNTVFGKLPNIPQDAQSTKIVILVDGTPFRVGPGYILGVANALGGQFGVFQNRLFLETTASMEVLGHDVGELYDRYLYPASTDPRSPGNIGNTSRPPYASNCSANPNGESFWKSAGAAKAYAGCTSQYMYAPAPLDCGSGGSSTTLMSAAQCGGQNFDPVEQYYLKTVILPRYQCIILTPTPTPTSSPTVAKPNTVAQTPIPIATPLPPKQNTTFYTCAPDPACKSGSGAMQVCALKCSAK